MKWQPGRKMLLSRTALMYLCALIIISLIHQSHGYDLTILHTNDVHARFEQFNKYGSACSDKDATAGKCFGGVARRMTKISEVRASQDNVVLLDGGDQFLGTLWFNQYKGQATSYFMKKLGYDAMCIGNHEFDLGDDVLEYFIDNVTLPVLSANTEVTSGSSLFGKIQKSVTITVGGEKIGIVGYTTTQTKISSKPSEYVTFPDVIASVTSEVRRLEGEGVNKIIAVGHAGYTMDLQVAKIQGVDVVVGGHTNTFLYNGDPPSNDDPIGPYPTVVTQVSGNRALVVQDYTWAKYLGYLNVTFDAAGVVQTFQGNPVVLDSTIAEDPATKAEIDAWGVPVREQNEIMVGSTNIFLNGRREFCRLKECTMANLFLDSLVDYFLGFPHDNTTWAPAAIAIWNGGGIRASIEKGEVTVGDIHTTLPFGNQVDLIVTKGYVLREMLEHSVRNLDVTDPGGQFLHFSGMRVVYDSRNVSTRVISAEVRCLECDTPSYFPLDDWVDYKVLINTFINGGGDGFDTQPLEIIRYNILESTVLRSYFERHSPVFTELDGRITFRNPDDDVSAAPGSNPLPALIALTLSCLFSLV